MTETARSTSNLDELRVNLPLKRVTNEEQQELLGKLVSLCFVDFLNEPSDERALEQVALISLAKSKGVKEAKKKILKLSRWATSLPPALSILKSTAEKLEAIKQLRSTKFHWGKEYVHQQLICDQQDKAVIEALLLWGRDSSADSAEYLRYLVTPFVAYSHSVTDSNLRLKACMKHLPPYADTDVNTLAQAVSDFEKSIISVLHDSESDKKQKTLFLQSAFNLYEELFTHLPTLTIHPTFATSIGKIINELGSLKTLPASFNDQFICIALNLLKNTTPTNLLSSAWLENLLSAFKRDLPNLEKRLKTLVGKDASLENIMDAKVQPKGTKSHVTNDPEIVFANLLVAWENFQMVHPGDETVSDLSRLIHLAASSASVEAFGTVGETVEFDPIAHSLADGELLNPTYVKILRSGVRTLREDGSPKILVTAFVESN